MQNQQDGLIIELEKLSDGAIVGDGRSDFTQEVGDYHFLIGDKKFVILDLPGIEGKEEIVQSSIDRAVEKAHVIFYVSKKPTPPQKGDNENLGTIEKISRQLSKQSEVYFIYNKPVRNPRQLKKPLIDQDDENGLLVVDEVLSAAFNENYVSHRSLSAYPAFLALGNFYSGKYFKDRGKFTEKFEGATHILELSQILQFADWMTGQLVDNVKDK
ncbi:N-acetylglucosamine-6-phosphate deacetylase, partial [Enterococcus faecium]|nr:N-acetylglucosamine-6-phosphate deacetylase [Enterococcus faecium]